LRRTREGRARITKGALRAPNAIVALIAFSGIASFAICAQQRAVATPDPRPAATSLHASHSEDTQQPDLPRRDARYRLCASDVIALTFPLTPEFDQTVSVQPDGFVSLAGAGDVHLEGLTTAESINAVKNAYGKVLRDPIVTIELKDFNKPYFIVGGQVGHPGKFDLRGDTSTTQAIAIAGGFTEAAKHSQVLLFRRANNDWYEVKLLNLKKVLQGHDIHEDTQVRDGDLLYVPQNFISKIKKLIPSTGVGAYYQANP